VDLVEEILVSCKVMIAGGVGEVKINSLRLGSVVFSDPTFQVIKCVNWAVWGD
jgi:hypothetical protein